MKKFAAYFVMALILGLPWVARAQTTAPCVIGYTIGFFNGVWNTELEAIDGRNALQNAVREATGNQDDTYNHEDVNYELFYNHTGSTVGATGLQDIAEVFEQRAQQLDPSGSLFGGNFYLFWEPFYGQPPGYADTSGSVNQSLQTFFTDFQNTVIQQSLTTLSALFSNPPTQTDYAVQWAKLDSLAAAGRKFMLVAHSQGNLFVDPAYDHIQPVVGSTRVKVVHIAPASPTLRGNYELADIDLVINALRLVNGFNTVPNVNISIPVSTIDKSGHTLVGTYLDGTRPGRANSERLMVNALGALVQSSCPVTVAPGSANIAPGTSSTTTLTANVNPPVTDTNVILSYAWSVSGNAGGLLSTGQGAPSTTAASLSPTVSYISSAATPTGAIDTVTLTVYAGAALADPTRDVSLGTATGVLTINTPGYVISGAGGGSFGVDDDLTVTLDGAQIYTDGTVLSGTRAPFTFQATPGQTLNFTVEDTYGHCSSLSPLYLSYSGSSTYTLVDPGFNLGCGRPGGDQGQVHNLSYVIPANIGP